MLKFLSDIFAPIGKTVPEPAWLKQKKRGSNPSPFIQQTATSLPLDFYPIFENSKRNVQIQQEENVRGKILDSFLKPSHGDLRSFSNLHLEILEKDPIFYGHLSRWYQETGSIRDHHELFASHLLASPFTEHREHGMALFQFLRPYQAARSVRYTKEALHYPTRMLKKAVQFYLKRREKNPLWFDECVIRDQHSLKYLYTTLHIRASARAEATLFQESPPLDSRVQALKELARSADDPDKQARIIAQKRIHFTTAVGAVQQITPGILYALLSVMTPQQVINHLKFFEKRGGLQNPDIKNLISEKLKDGLREARVADFKSLVALKKIRADEEISENLLRLTHERIRNRGRIQTPTALFVDKSGSMSECIDLGKQLAALCSTITDSEFYVYAFDTQAYEIKSSGKEFAEWDKAFRLIKPCGGTSIGSPFRHLTNQEIEQIILISDGEENTPPYFRIMLEKYEKLHQKEVRVLFIKVNKTAMNSPLELQMEGKNFTVISFNGDYYNLPNVIPLLIKGDHHDLVWEILKTPLYTKADLENLPAGFNEETYEIL